MPDYSVLRRLVADVVIESVPLRAEEIAGRVEEPLPLIKRILRDLDEKGAIAIATDHRGHMWVNDYDADDLRHAVESRWRPAR